MLSHFFQENLIFRMNTKKNDGEKEFSHFTPPEGISISEKSR